MTSRPRRYDNLDGSSELSFGFMLSALYVVDLFAPRVVNLSGYVLLFAGSLTAFLLLGTLTTKMIRTHISWPRTGYVRQRSVFKANPRKGILFVALVCLAAAALAAAVTMIQRNYEASPVRWLMVLGFLAPYAFFELYLSREYPWKRYLIPAMALALAVVALATPDNTASLARAVMLCSLAGWFLSGLGTLAAYVRRTKPAGPEQE